MSTEPNDLTAIESALRDLTPAASRLDRDGLMYAAGRDSRLSRLPLATACACAGLAAGMAVILLVRPPRIEERVTVVHVPVVVPDKPETAVEGKSVAAEWISYGEPDAGPSDNPLLEMRRQLLKRGDLAPLAPLGKTGTAPPARPLEKDLDLPPGSLDGVEPGRRSFTLGPG